MKQALIALVLVSSTHAFGAWCHIGTALVMCPKPPHAQETITNLQIALEVR